MDLKRLRYFAKSAELGSINKASEAVLISQPALSRQIRLLEEELGARLVERHSTGITLTEAGREFCARILPHVAAIDEAVQAIRQKATAGKAELTIALSPDIAALIAARIQAQAREALPGLTLRLLDSHVGVTARAIHSGEIDGAMVYGPRPHWQALEWGGLLSGVEEHELFIDEYVLVGPPDCPLAAGSTIRCADLAGYKLAVSGRQGQHYDARKALDKLARAAGGRIEFIELNSTGARKNLVESGQGFAFFPYTDIYKEIRDGRVRRYRLDSITVQRHAYLVVNHQCPHKDMVARLAGMFRAEIGRVAGEIGHEVRIA
ncbi:LysR family transcriptional regulator [Novosphingobium bradum]|uniref:LysR family transcriptional regulator n=1 Tax=Novosphingobium bradum TaxID=1737444 RepID=A0ABV7ITC6_9SPHN